LPEGSAPVADFGCSGLSRTHGTFYFSGHGLRPDS